MWNEIALLQICEVAASKAPVDVLVSEPYLPYVPEGWNGTLVLAEAQNLGGSPEYLKRLRAAPPRTRMLRLGDAEIARSGHVGVGPWDIGPIKLALKAVWPDIALESVAVSNAVPWSRASSSGANANPDDLMIDHAVEFWRQLVDCWQPDLRHVVTVGKVAREVAKRLFVDGASLLPLRSPSPNYLRRIAGMFCSSDLLRRYPEVAAAVEQVGSPDGDADSAVFFACHAVSIARTLR